jgi:hypothetical protein
VTLIGFCSRSRGDGDVILLWASSELVEQVVSEREFGGGQGNESAYQVSLGNSAAEQSADIQGELVEIGGGVGVEQDGELAGWECFDGCWSRGAVRGCNDGRRRRVGRSGFLQLVAGVCGPVGHGLSFLSVVSTRS